MTDRYLVFSLTGSLGAMGELSGHERRGSMAWPGRSAVIGMLGAALGIDRGGDFAALDALAIAVAVFDTGAPLRDYHTIETVPSAAVKSPNSRPEALALARGRTNTSITLRDYRTGPLFGVAVHGGDLGRLADALSRPRYVLYLGRKSCPLACPVGAQIVEADSFAAALTRLRLPPWRQGAVAHLLVTDAASGAGMTETVQDVPVDRARWHFARREVSLQSVAIAPDRVVQ